jgi:PhnB protein
MTVHMNPYLVLDGNAKEAIAFYQKALDGTVVAVQTLGDMPPDPSHPAMPDAMKDRVMHGHLKVGEADLMFTDTYPGMPYQKGNNVQIALTSTDADTARKLFDALSEGAQVHMPLQQTFFSPAYGQLTDKYGVTWQILTEGPH